MEEDNILKLGEVRDDELSDSLLEEERDEEVIERYLEYLAEIRDSQYPLWMKDIYK
jgi:hypothetical protein